MTLQDENDDVEVVPEKGFFPFYIISFKYTITSVPHSPEYCQYFHEMILDRLGGCRTLLSDVCHNLG